MNNNPKLAADGPIFNLAGYASDLLANLTNLVALIGAILIYMSPFMSWEKKSLGDTTTTATLFDLSGKNAELALHSPLLLVAAILLVISGLAMLLFSARENIRYLRPFAYNYLLRMAPVLIGIISLVLVFINSKFNNSIDNPNIETGVGIIFSIAGIVLYAVSVIMDRANA